jgi:hypothetical protein
LFGTKSDRVPVEFDSKTGTWDDHWLRNSKDGKQGLGNELMCTGGDASWYWPMSTITVASLADLGYTVNYKDLKEYPLQTPKRALVGATVTPATASARPVPNNATSARASLATGLSARAVDATFADLKTPARRIATANESFSRARDADEPRHDRSLKPVRSAIDLAWDDFPGRRLARRIG